MIKTCKTNKDLVEELRKRLNTGTIENIVAVLKDKDGKTFIVSKTKRRIIP